MYPSPESAGTLPGHELDEHPGIHLLEDELRTQSNTPPGGEAAIGAFCAAALERSKPGGDLRPILHDMLAHRAPVSDDYSDKMVHSSELVNTLFGVIVAYKESLHPKFNIAKLTQADDWTSLTDRFIATYNGDLNTKDGGLSHEQVHDLLEKYTSDRTPAVYFSIVGVMSQILRERFMRPVRLANGGEGSGLAGHLTTPTPGCLPFDKVLATSDITYAANLLISSRQAVDQVVYFDKQKVVSQYGEFLPQWLRLFNGARPPLQKNSQHIEDFYSSTLSEDYPHTNYNKLDFDDKNDLDKILKENKNSFDIVSINLNKTDPQDYEKIAQLLTRNGILLIRSMDIITGSLCVDLYDNASKSKSIQKISTSAGGALSVQFTSVKLAIGKKLWTPEERILHLAKELN